MAQRSVTIASRVGLHARPAMIFVQTVSSLGVPVRIALKGKAGEEPVDASSILGVMALGAKFGDEVVLEADADSVLDELAALLARDLDAEDASAQEAEPRP